MTGNGNGTPPPISLWRSLGGLLCLVIVGTAVIIDATSATYSMELGPMGLLLGTGAVLLGVEISGLIKRISSGG